jgi:hypothetical protein
VNHEPDRWSKPKKPNVDVRQQSRSHHPTEDREDHRNADDRNDKGQVALQAAGQLGSLLTLFSEMLGQQLHSQSPLFSRYQQLARTTVTWH